MNYFEIKPDGQAYIRTDSGTVIRKVGNGEKVNHADFNRDETLFAITYISGMCEIRDRKNNLVKTIATEGVSEAYWKLKSSETKRKLFRKVDVTEYIMLLMEDGTKVEVTHT